MVNHSSSTRTKNAGEDDFRSRWSGGRAAGAIRYLPEPTTPHVLPDVADVAGTVEARDCLHPERKVA